MDYYYLLKFIHILSATFLFGTGIGTAFFMLLAYLSQDVATLKQTTRHVVLADWIFTTPAIIIQPLSGIALMMILHYPFHTWWFALTVFLYLLAGACWLPVVFIQYRLRYLANHSQNNHLPPEFHNLMRWWIMLGIPAFIALIVIYWLMVSKQGLNTLLF